jgi:cytochrome c peroxidase
MKKNIKILALTVLLLMPFAIKASEPIKPLPNVGNVDKAKVALGQKLFHEKKLSPDGTVSCSSCHDLNKGGTDNLPTSKGIRNQIGPINSPTVYNSRFNLSQFWDGRAKDLQDQAGGPVENPKEMGSNWPLIIKFLKSNPVYMASFNLAYQGKINKLTVTDAIAEYEKTLVTPSPFDDYLKGNKKAISVKAKRGYQLFKSKGCIACHSGVNVGGGMYMKMGMVNDYFKFRHRPMTEADKGRFNVTGNKSDMHVFKVPTLRNIELTAPYFHDGSEPSLHKAVWIMGRHQLGVDLTKQDTDDIVAFLKTLTGKALKKGSAH